MRTLLYTLLAFLPFALYAQTKSGGTAQGLGAGFSKTGSTSSAIVVGQAAATGFQTYSTGAYSGNLGLLHAEASNNNVLPIANAGADQQVSAQSTVKLDGSLSKDLLGRALSYTWRALDATVSLSDPRAKEPSFRAPSVLVQQKFKFVLEVNNGTKSSTPDTVEITVRDPAWIAITYPGSNSLIAKVSINTVPAAVGDLVGAFVNGQCRGVAEVFLFNGQSMVTLVVQTPGNETLRFKVFDVSAAKICDATESVTTLSNGDLGTPSNPILINADCNKTVSDTLLVVTPNEQSVPALAGQFSVNVASTLAWKVSADASWLSPTPTQGASSASISINYSANPNNTVRIGTLTFSSGKLTQTVKVTQAGNTGGNSTPPWGDPIPSIVVHTVAITSNLQSEINGQPLVAGDYIGFFFKVNGEFKIAGLSKWEAKNTLIEVFGDEAGTSTVEGYRNGETFLVKIWRAAEQNEYDVQAVFSPIGTPIGGLSTNATNLFKDQALSAIASLRSNSLQTMVIPLVKGWNLISANVIPKALAMDSVFLEIMPYLEQVRSIDKAFIPQFANAIGNWNYQEGYLVKVREATDLRITGRKVSAAETKVPLKEGWQYIAYLCDQSQTVGQVFAAFDKDVATIRDISKSYVPNFNQGDVICMRLGQGYKVKGNAGLNKELIFNCSTSNCTSPFAPDELEKADGLSITDNSAMLLFPRSIMSQVQPGWAINAYDAQGRLCGRSMYRDANLVMTIWGDDLSSTKKEGLQKGEPFSILVEDEKGQLFEPSEVGILERSWRYLPNELYWMESPRASNHEIKISPNPTDQWASLQLKLAHPTSCQWSLFDLQGKLLSKGEQKNLERGAHQETIDCSQFAAGTYLLKVQLNDQVWNQKIVVQPR